LEVDLSTQSAPALSPVNSTKPIKPLVRFLGRWVYKPAAMSSVPNPSPAIDRTVAGIRARVGAWRGQSEKVALIPTMGALHEGHLALIRVALETADRTVVSIFVNPTQFGANEDFGTYPRNEEADLAALAELGVDAVFAPSVEEMYPEGFATEVRVAGPAEGLETDFRPHFFSGVATVVAKLLIACTPDSAIFGEKDYQQLLVIKRAVADLGIPVEIRGCPTVREADGLALSSRNAYLSPQEREIAPLLHRALLRAAAALHTGAPPSRVLPAANNDLREAGFRVDYFELRNAETLAPVNDPKTEPLRLLAAAWLGKTRLIDNIAV
jgi:pantoate--beta-alanine ligase